MTAINCILWILAFLGVAVIYFGGRVLRLCGKEVTSAVDIAVRSIGILISAAAMIILYTSGGLI